MIAVKWLFVILILKWNTGSQAMSKGATPLCLPNNVKWNSSLGQYIQTGERGTSLYVVDEALEKLGRIQGKVNLYLKTGIRDTFSRLFRNQGSMIFFTTMALLVSIEGDFFIAL